jgi:hypothetical protein
MLGIFRYRFFYFLLLFSFGTNSFAGWTSSGGENLRDKINPWFLPNTSQVNYCILHDAQNFGQNLNDVKARVRKVLQIWKHQLQNLEFKTLYGPFDGKPELTLGTQEFIETSCEQADLNFQFGILTDEQFAKVSNPTQFMGLTVRTDYDQMNLRAKGFIYFSPERGPLKFNKENLIENPWSRDHGSFLLLALLHETGHLFGLQHGNEVPFMHESYLENLFVKNNYEFESDANWASEIERSDLFKKANFFKVEAKENVEVYRSCSSSAVSSPAKPIKIPEHNNVLGTFSSPIRSAEIFNKYMGFKSLDSGTQSSCTRLYFKKDSEAVFETTQNRNRKKSVLVGKAKKLLRLDSWHDRYAIVKIWLPKKQKVLSFYPGTEKNYLEKQLDLGIMQTTSLFKGTYQILESKLERPFFIEAKTFGRLRFGGTMDNIYYMDLYEGF